MKPFRSRNYSSRAAKISCYFVSNMIFLLLLTDLPSFAGHLVVSAKLHHRFIATYRGNRCRLGGTAKWSCYSRKTNWYWHGYLIHCQVPRILSNGLLISRIFSLRLIGTHQMYTQSVGYKQQLPMKLRRLKYLIKKIDKLIYLTESLNEHLVKIIIISYRKSSDQKCRLRHEHWKK